MNSVGHTKSSVVSSSTLVWAAMALGCPQNTVAKNNGSVLCWLFLSPSPCFNVYITNAPNNYRKSMLLLNAICTSCYTIFFKDYTEYGI